MNENSTWLLNRRRQAQEEAERNYVETPRDEPGTGDRIDREGRAFRTCSICRAAGLVEESKGHIALGHDAWLKQQPGHLQAHFKGQGAIADATPRLVKPAPR